MNGFSKKSLNNCLWRRHTWFSIPCLLGTISVFNFRIFQSSFLPLHPPPMSYFWFQKEWMTDFSFRGKEIKNFELPISLTCFPSKKNSASANETKNTHFSSFLNGFSLNQVVFKLNQIYFIFKKYAGRITNRWSYTFSTSLS